VLITFMFIHFKPHLIIFFLNILSINKIAFKTPNNFIEKLFKKYIFVGFSWSNSNLIMSVWALTLTRICSFNLLIKIQLFLRSELDSELLDDKSTVLGVLTADDKGLCLLGESNFPFLKFFFYKSDLEQHTWL